jgi:hypothetical protein
VSLRLGVFGRGHRLLRTFRGHKEPSAFVPSPGFSKRTNTIKITERTCYVVENKGMNIRKLVQPVMFKKTSSLCKATLPGL